MEASLRILMESLIDYAGLFPPASLDMDAAVRNHAAYRRSAESAWLGRFVVPAARLEEFAQSFAAVIGSQGNLPGGSAGAASGTSPGSAAEAGDIWLLSALIGKDLEPDLALIRRFNQGQKRDGGVSALVDALEMKVSRPDQIGAALAAIPGDITAYFEIPIQDDPMPYLSAIARAGARAKVRTGGVTEELIPEPELLARFIKGCARTGVAFKATAGLHHPVRCLRSLTYASDSPRGVMHGFLNVFLAAAFAANGMDEDALADLLREESPRAFSFREDEAAWKGNRLSLAKLAAARRDFAIAFGSCSFEEPREDLQEATLL